MTVWHIILPAASSPFRTMRWWVTARFSTKIPGMVSWPPSPPPQAPPGLRWKCSDCWGTEMRIRTTPPIRVRIALHRGKVFESSFGARDYHGRHVNMAFRLEKLDSGMLHKHVEGFPEVDRIFCTQNFVDALRKEDGEDHWELLDMGPADIKGEKKPTRVYWMKGLR